MADVGLEIGGNFTPSPGVGDIVLLADRGLEAIGVIWLLVDWGSVFCEDTAAICLAVKRSGGSETVLGRADNVVPSFGL